MGYRDEGAPNDQPHAATITATGRPTRHGINIRRDLNALADAGIIARTGGAYVIPFGSCGADIIAATPDFSIGAQLSR